MFPPQTTKRREKQAQTNIKQKRKKVTKKSKVGEDNRNYVEKKKVTKK